jgi:hypothetical protein
MVVVADDYDSNIMVLGATEEFWLATWRKFGWCVANGVFCNKHFL